MPAGFRVAAWTARALRDIRRRLGEGGLAGARVHEAPHGSGSQRVMNAVLRLGHASCLERALIRQEWLRAHGRRVEVVIGVTGPADFGAHAWLDGEEPHSTVEFAEIRRLAPQACIRSADVHLRPVDLRCVHPRVESVEPEELVVRPALHDPPLVEDEHQIGPPHSRQPMGDDERRPARKQGVEALLDGGLGLVVEV